LPTKKPPAGIERIVNRLTHQLKNNNAPALFAMSR